MERYAETSDLRDFEESHVSKTGTEIVRGRGWTVATRRPRAFRFLRVDDLNVTWSEARDIAAEIAKFYPELEVYYVSTVEAESAGLVATEDLRNVLTEGGKRIRIFEGGKRSDFVAVFPLGDRSAEDLEGLFDRLSSAEGSPSEVRSAVLLEIARERAYRSAVTA